MNHLIINALDMLQQFAATCQPKAHFFLLPTWYKYLDGEQIDAKCVPTVTSFVDLSLIGLAILDMLLRIAGMAAVGAIIYGGIKMIMSSGEPDKIKTARNTVINGVVGMVIAIVAATVVSYIGSSFGG